MYIKGRELWTQHPNIEFNHVEWQGQTKDIRVHHTAINGPTTSYTIAQETAYLRNLETSAINNNGYIAIPYSYLIFPTGRVWEGRGFEQEGAHTLGHNDDIGVAFTGNYETKRPTQAQLRAYLDLRLKLKDLGAGPRYNIMHRETYATVCPGRYIVEAFDQPNLGL